MKASEKMTHVSGSFIINLTLPSRETSSDRRPCREERCFWQVALETSACFSRWQREQKLLSDQRRFASRKARRKGVEEGERIDSLSHLILRAFLDEYDWEECGRGEKKMLDPSIAMVMLAEVENRQRLGITHRQSFLLRFDDLHAILFESIRRRSTW